LEEGRDARTKTYQNLFRNKSLKDDGKMRYKSLKGLREDDTVDRGEEVAVQVQVTQGRREDDAVDRGEEVAVQVQARGSAIRT
jgi:predicted AAA+ superfamily ATPase